MPRVVSVQSAFTSGELSPGAYGRVDIAKYAQGMTCLRNYLPTALGGVDRRPGLRFICETKFSQFNSALIPFVPTATSAYILEAGCEYLRVYKNNAVIGLTELMSNGTFDTDLTGWTLTATGTTVVEWVPTEGGRMRLHRPVVATGSIAVAQQNVTVVSGVTYRVSVQIADYTGPGNLLFYLGSTTNGFDLGAHTLSGAGTHTFNATMTTTTLSVQMRVGESGIAEAFMDNVSVRREIPLEIATPYNYGQVTSIDTVQSADEMYVLHQCVPTFKLQRYGDDCYRFTCVTFVPPTVEFGARPNTEIQAAALTGTNVIFNALNGATFLASDVGREIQMTSGANAGARAGIKFVCTSTLVTGNICVPWLTTTASCRGTWKISASPQTGCKPDDNAPVGKLATLTLDANGWRGVSVTTDSDCGKYALVNGGMYELTCIASATVARAIIRGEASGVTKAEAGAWSLEETLWSCTRGFPQTGDFHDDRLYLDAGFRFAGSKVSDYENFGLGVLDDDGVLFPINAKTITTVRGLVGARALQIFTSGGEFVASATEGSPITPTNVHVSAESTYGSGGVPPLRIGDVTLFLTRSGKHLREFTIPKDSISDSYVAPDLLLLAEHLTRTSGIVALAYQQEPDQRIWCVRADGELLSCTYRREENVVAWAKHNTCGTFESVAVIPHPDGDRDQVWFIVNRTINGATVRYVEYLDDSTLGPYPQRHTDSAWTFACTSTRTLTGINHLECAYVQVLANGVFLCSVHVVGGAIDLGATTTGPFEVGLPFTSEGITLQPEVSFGAGSIQPMRKRWARVFLRTRDSCSMVVRTGASAAFESVPTGESIGNGVRDHDIPRLGTFTDGSITFRQENPLPSHVLMVGGVLDIGEA